MRQAHWSDDARLQRDQRDLRGAIEADGDAYGADPAIDVELQTIKAKETLHVLPTKWWKDQRAKDRQAYLASV